MIAKLAKLPNERLLALRKWVPLIIILIAAIIVMVVNLTAVKYVTILLIVIGVEIIALNIINQSMQYILYNDLDLNKWLSMSKYIDEKRNTIKSKQDYLMASIRVNYYKGHFSKSIAQYNELDLKSVNTSRNAIVLMTSYDLFKSDLMSHNFDEAKKKWETVNRLTNVTKKDAETRNNYNEFTQIMVNILELEKSDESLDNWTPYSNNKLAKIEKKYFQALNNLLGKREARAVELFHEVIRLGNDQFYYVIDSKKRLEKLGYEY